MKTITNRRETSTHTIESFLDSIKISSKEPVRVECGITNNYDWFGDYFANRELNKKRSTIIGKDMKKYGNFSSIQCIREGNKLLVWDGQHVLAAAIYSGKHVNYDVWDRVPDNILALKNKNTKQWTLENFHIHQIKKGSIVARKVENFMDVSRHVLGRRIALTASLRLLGGVYSNQHYKDGNFEINTPDHAEKVLGYLRDLAKYINFASDSKFVQSFHKVVRCGLYKHEVMKKRLPKHYKLLHSQLKVIDVVIGIEECYNARSRSPYVDFVSACGLKRK